MLHDVEENNTCSYYELFLEFLTAIVNC